jgi:hypothetical protein
MRLHVDKQKALIKVRSFLNQTGIRSKKVFVVGFNKTGTVSIHILFESLGLPSYHGVEWRSCEDMKLLKSYDCFSDGVPKDLPKLDHMFPGSKFILQVRDLDTWVYSRLAHIEREKERTRIFDTQKSSGWNNTEYATKGWIKKRNTHHLFVLSYFIERPSDLLVVNFVRDELAATKICNFLGYEGKHERPQRNINPEEKIPLKHIEMLAKAISELGVPQHELKYDIYCPSLANNDLHLRFPADTSNMK